MKSYIEIMLEQKQFRVLTDEDYFELAKILEKEHGKPFTLGQAKEIGDGLITILTTLANGRKIIHSESLKGHVESNFSNRGGFDKR